MHDLTYIRANPELFDAALARRGLPPASQKILELDTDRHRLVTSCEQVQAKKKQIAKQIGLAKRTGDDTADLEAVGKICHEDIVAYEATLKIMDEKLKYLLSGLPNILDQTVPDGLEEHYNKVVFYSLLGIPGFWEKPKEHFEMFPEMDFETATKIAGTRSVILKVALAKLERALGQFMLDMHTGTIHGYTEASVPLLVIDYHDDRSDEFFFYLYRTRSRPC